MYRCDADRFRFLLETEAELCAFLADEVLEADADDERPKYITNYIGSKQKLADWIWKSTPDDIETAVDAFSGSSVVGYMYKTHGLAVHAVDRLAYCHHIARAIVENDSTTLSDEEIDSLLVDNPKAKDFVRKHFKGIYFEPGVHAVIDTIRSNIDDQGLTGHKKDIALFALGKACITGKGGFRRFDTTQKQDGRADSPKEFRERFVANCKRISALVFKGEKPCKAFHGDTRKVLAGIKADVAYFDPPYATQFSQTNYERAYHFIEGLMTWWDGKEIRGDTKTRQYEIPTEVTKANAGQFFQEFLGAAKHIKHWLISYRDKAFPSEKEIKKIVAAVGKSSRMKSREDKYTMSSKRGENSTAREHLFVCTPASSASSSGDQPETAQVALAEFGQVVDESLKAAAPGWDESDNEYRYRIRPPDQFVKESFRSKQLEGVDGIALVLGKFKSEFVPEGGDAESMVVQSVRFEKKDWDLDEAKKWFEEHRKTFAWQREAADDEERSNSMLSLNAHHDPESGGKYARELVFIGSDPTKAKAAPERNIHTHIDGQLEVGSLSTAAGQSTDKRFSFVLTHIGSNLNGDYFAADELRGAAKTAIGRKIDLSHSQEFRDIVGGIVEAKYVEDGDNSRVECVGELYTGESEPARLAHKLMDRGIVTHVSMECDYEEGECSVCGKRVKSKSDYCTHLKNYKGREYKGKKVYEILHGITFTGMALLDRAGADEDARIRQVAERQRLERRDTMGNERKTEGQNLMVDPATLSEEQRLEFIKILQAEVKRLTDENAKLREGIEEMTAEQKRAKRESRAEQLLAKWEEVGRKFADEASRKQELDRLLELSDDAFEATAKVVETLEVSQVTGDSEYQEGSDEPDEGENAEANASKKGEKKIASKATRVKKNPKSVSDDPSSLADELKNGLMVAYQDRHGAID